MKLLQLLRRESDFPLFFLAFIAGISGLSNAFILVIINIAARQSSQDKHNTLYIFLFATVILIFIFVQRYIYVRTSVYVERALHKIRLRIVDKILESELLALEHIGRAEIYASVSKETQILSQATINLVMLGQSVILIFFALIYIALLSLMAFVLFVAFIAVSALIFLQWFKRIEKAMSDSLMYENELFKVLTHQLDGFKEAKMSQKRRDDLREHLAEISASVATMRRDTRSAIALMGIAFQTSFYLFIGVQIFLLPLLTSTRPEDMTQITMGVLFLVGPIGAMLGGINMFATANVAANNIETLEAAITQHNRAAAKRKADPLVIHEEPFREITFEQAEFSYTTDGQSTFTLGPLDLSIAPGEVTFISGGNGSGKSTFLRLLTCLYFPTSGEVKVDGQRLGETNASAYRNLFSVIFYDYHLFKRLYGIRNINQQRVEEMLLRLQLHNKTSLIEDRFSTVDLSSGQRRRLALIVNYLENKPICVFDEWAAEQDPDFRRYFYREILPDLKSQGKTIIAVTHDDQYYNMDYIDRFLKFQDGQLVAGV